ncbi:MAG: homoserine kinase [Chloroflexi bacterium]|nr:homoserine kinase [Chloroflexota bacterium]MCC6896440.1 homoserine kinase [Anaerolineae bacterium]
MYKVKITLPATVTNLGPGLNSLGLAVGLYTIIEISRRSDEQLIVETEGEGAGRYGMGLRHPTALAIMRLFQKQEKAVLGLNIKISNHIPLSSGLGAEAAFWVAGLIGANNLMNGIYNRKQILEIAATVSGLPSQVVTSIMGGLTASFTSGEQVIYRALPTSSLNVVVALPQLKQYSAEGAKVKPDRVPLNDALFNLSRVPLLVEALRTGDLKLIGQLMDDRLHIPYLKPQITGFDHASEMARRAGAVAVSLSGEGPALVAFAENNHKLIATTMELAFENSGVKARTWVVPIDTQGVVISVSGS